MINIREIAEAVESNETVTVWFFSTDGRLEGTVDRVTATRKPIVVDVDGRPFYVAADDVTEVEIS